MKCWDCVFLHIGNPIVERFCGEEIDDEDPHKERECESFEKREHRVVQEVVVKEKITREDAGELFR